VLSARLGAALDWLLAHWIDGPELVCGDADSSLLAMARRDSQGEDRILTGRFGR
jgi:hypothetical protein